MSDDEAEPDMTHLNADGTCVMELKSLVFYSLPEKGVSVEAENSTRKVVFYPSIAEYMKVQWHDRPCNMYQPYDSGTIAVEAQTSILEAYLANVHPSLLSFAGAMTNEGFTTLESLVFFDRDCGKELKMPMAPLTMLLNKIEKLKLAAAADKP